MAVVKIIGRADEFELTFILDSSGQWVATVPFDADGRYAIELWAYDEAGNESYQAQMIMVLDKTKLSCKLIPFPYQLELKNPFYLTKLQHLFETKCEVIRTRYFCSLATSKFFSSIVDNKYRTEVHVIE